MKSVFKPHKLGYLESRHGFSIILISLHGDRPFSLCLSGYFC